MSRSGNEALTRCCTSQWDRKTGLQRRHGMPRTDAHADVWCNLLLLLWQHPRRWMAYCMWPRRRARGSQVGIICAWTDHHTPLIGDQVRLHTWFSRADDVRREGESYQRRTAPRRLGPSPRSGNCCVEGAATSSTLELHQSPHQGS